MERYKITKSLGDGSFGTVFKAIDLHDNNIVAIKKMKQKYKDWDECVQLREVKSLRRLQHPNLIKLKEVIKIADELYLVFDFLEYNLFQVYNSHKEKGRRLTENEIRGIIYQITQGLAHLHKNGFFHRDLKPENILFDNNVVKICDFGLAREIRSRPPFTEYVSTRWYRAPELLLRSTSYNSPVDIFALGCIMAELYLQNPLFPGANELDQLGKTIEVLGSPSKADWPEGYKLALAMNYSFPQKKKQQLADLIPDASSEAIDLLESMLQYSSRKRPSASDILKHPFFEKLVNIEKLSAQIQEAPKQILTKFQSLENNSIIFPNNVKVQNPKEIEMRKTRLKFGHKDREFGKNNTNNYNNVKESNNNNSNNGFGSNNNISEKERGNKNEFDLNISRKFEEIEEILSELSKTNTKDNSNTFTSSNNIKASEPMPALQKLPQLRDKKRQETRETEDFIKLPFFNQTNTSSSTKLPAPTKLPFEKPKFS